MSKRNPRRKPTAQTSKERHIAAIQAEMARVEARSPIGQRRIFASFPELEDLFERCAWLVSVVDPTAGRTMGTIGRTSDHDNVAAMMAAGDRVAWFRRHQEWLQDELKAVNQDLADKIEKTDYDSYREEAPRCWYRDCRDDVGKPTRGRRQPIDATECQWCKRPFSKGQTGAR